MRVVVPYHKSLGPVEEQHFVFAASFLVLLMDHLRSVFVAALVAVQVRFQVQVASALHLTSPQ